MLRRSIQIFLLLFVPLPALAQSTPRSLLWKVSGSEGGKPSFLFGTMHSRDSRAYQFGDTVHAALKSVSVVAGELDLTNAAGDALGMMNTMMLPEGQKLEDLYKKKEWALIEAGLKETIGPMAVMTYRMKPFFVLAMLTEAGMQADEEKVLDDHLLSTAKENGQRVIGLETMKEQMAAMDAMSVKEQAGLLLDHVKNDGYEKELGEMMDAYAAQDLDAIMKISESSGTMNGTMEKALITDRNERMVHRLDSMMQVGEDVFFAVGAAHLPGEKGLIQLLRAQGYTVEPVIYAVKPQPIEEEQIEPAIEEKE